MNGTDEERRSLQPAAGRRSRVVDAKQTEKLPVCFESCFKTDDDLVGEKVRQGLV